MQALIFKIFRPIGYLDPTWMSFKFYCYLQSRYWGGQYEVMNLSLFEAVKTEISTISLFHFFLYLTCSQTLYFLFKVRRARVIIGSISAVSRVRSLILPGGMSAGSFSRTAAGKWVRAHFPEQRLVIEPSVIKNKKQVGIYWPPAQRGRGGEEENRRSLFFVLALRARRCFRKERKVKKKKQRLGTGYSLFERQFELKSIRKDPNS